MTGDAGRPMGSDYLQWAKTSSQARYNLTSSGVPYVTLAELSVERGDVELSGSGAYGWPPLQQAIANHYQVSEESVVAAMGASMANHVAMAALLRPGDDVLVEHPTYEPLTAVARYLGARVHTFARRAEDGFRIDPAEVERRMTPGTRLIVLTNLHNPSSARADDDTLRTVGRIAERFGARVLVDEVYVDALWDDVPRSAFQLGPAFVATNSLTKVYGLNGLRCGWILAEPALAARMWRLTELFNNIGAHPAERLSLAAFRRLPALAARSRALLERNGAALNAFLRSRADLACPEHRFGTVAFPRLLRGTVDGLCGRLRREHDTSVVPGAFFGMPDHFRIGLGTDADSFAEGLSRVAQALDEAPDEGPG